MYRGGVVVNVGRCERCRRPIYDPVSMRYALGRVCRTALGVVTLGAVVNDEQRERRRRLRRGKQRRTAEACGQLRLPLQLMLPWVR